MPHHHCHRGHHPRDDRPDDERRFARREDWLGDPAGQGPRHGPGRGGNERGGRHGHGPGRGLGRSLEHGDLRFVILDLIAERPRHGYEIIKAMEDASGGAYSPSPGVIYPTLTLLADLGHATVEEEGGRKLYALTPAGRAFLEENTAQLRAVQGRIAEMQARGAGEPPAAMVRAMENLKLALRLKLAQGTPTEEQARRIAALLDATALDVEKI